MIYHCVYYTVYEKDVFKNVAKRKKIKNINKLTIYAFCVFNIELITPGIFMLLPLNKAFM